MGRIFSCCSVYSLRILDITYLQRTSYTNHIHMQPTPLINQIIQIMEKQNDLAIVSPLG